MSGGPAACCELRQRAGRDRDSQFASAPLARREGDLAHCARGFATVGPRGIAWPRNLASGAAFVTADAAPYPLASVHLHPGLRSGPAWGTTSWKAGLEAAWQRLAAR